jgi:3-oxoisoapionate decarboxylase
MLTRRTFMQSAAALAGASAFRAEAGTQAPLPGRGIALGFDHFSLRAFDWKAPALIDHAGSLKLDAVLLSELNVFERRDEAYLKELKAKADALGLRIYMGMGSICPSSGTFNAKEGSAPDQVHAAIRMARVLGSPVVRCFLGRFDDRLTDGGIERHIANTVEVCKTVRSDLQASGVKLAVENHAGDMQAWELASLIQAAGPDVVGVNYDPGNAVWTMEEPIASLEILAPHVVCTSVRDSAIWDTPEGAVVQWTAMGDGDVDLRAWTTLFAERCKGVPVFIETISGLQRPFPYLKPEFWKPWPKARAGDFARWLSVARRGKPREKFTAPEGGGRRAAEQAHQKAELEKSLAYCRRVLGMGIRT